MGSLKYYSEMGRPAKPIRLMVGLMILKTVGKSSAMNALSRPFVQNPYYQAFCGEKSFQWQLPCDPTDFVYFRKRIGEDVTRLIFEALSANIWQRGPP